MNNDILLALSALLRLLMLKLRWLLLKLSVILLWHLLLLQRLWKHSRILNHRYIDHLWLVSNHRLTHHYLRRLWNWLLSRLRHLTYKTSHVWGHLIRRVLLLIVINLIYIHSLRLFAFTFTFSRRIIVC